MDESTKRLQAKIRDKYPDLLEKNLVELCGRCAWFAGTCSESLLPVTSKGENCPYYKEKE
jgi:hypothetical protein